MARGKSGIARQQDSDMLMTARLLGESSEFPDAIKRVPTLRISAALIA